MAWIAAILGRLCLAALFVISGVTKLVDPAGTASELTAAGLPSSFGMPVGIFEVVAGLLLAIGFMTRLTAIVLAVFVALSTLVYHSQISDPVQAQNALKNLAIVGGLLMVFAYGQVSWRLDTWKERNRRQDAEVAAARAEARADALDHNRTVVVERQPVATAAVPERRRFFDRRRTIADRTDGDPRT